MPLPPCSPLPARPAPPCVQVPALSPRQLKMLARASLDKDNSAVAATPEGMIQVGGWVLHCDVRGFVPGGCCPVSRGVVPGGCCTVVRGVVPGCVRLVAGQVRKCGVWQW